MLEFKDAVREQVLLRMAIVGANGSGKTLAALRVAAALGGPVAVLDTEHGRAKLYADRFTFKHADLLDHRPEAFRDAARQAAELVGREGTVVIDSLSHEWLEVLTEADKFADWKSLTPRHKEFLEAIISIPSHLIVTMRAKVKYQVTEVEVAGRDKPRQVIERVGVGPVQREGVEYEFDILAYLDTDHDAHFANRCDPLVDRVLPIEDEAIGIITKWLAEGDPPPPPPPFDPGKELLPGAISGSGAAAQILKALEELEPSVDWPETLARVAESVYSTRDTKKLAAGVRAEWLRRISNATAKLSTFATGDFPPVTEDEISQAFAFAFDGTVISVVYAPREPEDSGADPAEQAEGEDADRAAEAYDQEQAEMAALELDQAALEAAGGETRFG